MNIVPDTIEVRLPIRFPRHSLDVESRRIIRDHVTLGNTLEIARRYSSAVVSPGIQAAVRDVNASLRTP